MFRNNRRDSLPTQPESGQTMTEYAMLIAVLTLLVLAAGLDMTQYLSDAVAEIFDAF